MQAIIFDWRGIQSQFGNETLSLLMRGDAGAALTAYHAGLFNVYTFESDTAMDKDGIFHILNMEHPEGYEDRSMSVGDIIIENNNNVWICKPLGWENIAEMANLHQT